MFANISKLKNLFKGDKVIWAIFFLLCIISVVEVYSSSASLGYKSGNYWKAAFSHIGTIFLGITFIIVIANIPCKYFRGCAPLGVITSGLMLAYVALFGETVNGASRWIDLGIFTIQPSEFAKGAMVTITARILSGYQTSEGADPKAFKGILIMGAILILPIFPENFSTAFLLSSIVFMMMIIGRVPKRQIWKLLNYSVIVVIIFITLALTCGHSNSEKQNDSNTQLTEILHNESYKNSDILKPLAWLIKRFDTWNERIHSFGAKDNTPAEEYDLNKNSQVGYANIAIASSGLIGCGIGNSIVRDYLPLAFSDFIYAIIIEELGWIGAFFVALLYVLLLFRSGIIANKCANPFPAFLTMGLALLICVQALFNMMVVVGLAPVTGQPLPLISKGGTSTIINCIYIGMILSVSRTAKKKDSVVKKISK